MYEEETEELRRYTLREILIGAAHPILYWTFGLTGLVAVGMLAAA